MKYIGKTKMIKKYLGFLEAEYDMKFEFQSFDDYLGFCGPIDTYSFYNKFGCFTLHNVVQRGEWEWFVSKKFSTNQYELLGREIYSSLYLNKTYFMYSSVLRDLSKIIKNQICLNKEFFGIKIDK